MTTRREFLEGLAAAEKVDIGFGKDSLFFSIICDKEDLESMPSPLFIFPVSISLRQDDGSTRQVRGAGQYRFRDEVRQAMTGELNGQPAMLDTPYTLAEEESRGKLTVSQANELADEWGMSFEDVAEMADSMGLDYDGLRAAWAEACGEGAHWGDKDADYGGKE
jgi:hypothetical protein